MRLRAFIYGRTKVVTEMLYRFFSSAGKSFDLSKDEVEKRERLVQTYLVVFGLLLSYDFDSDFQAGLMRLFIAFLLASLAYYSMLARSVGSKRIRNFVALLMASVFSSAIVYCYASFTGYFFGIWFLFLIMTCCVALPLFV